MYFSKMINGFIPTGWIEDGTYAQLPTDAVELTNDEITTFYKITPPAGKELGILGGRPAWVDPPPLSAEELIADAEQKRQVLRTEAEDIIAPLSRAVKLGVATEEESALLLQWEMYTVLLMRVDLSKPEWPQVP